MSALSFLLLSFSVALPLHCCWQKWENFSC